MNKYINKTLAEQLEKLDSYIDFVVNTKCEAMKSNSCSCVKAGRLMTRHSIEDANVYKTLWPTQVKDV